MLDFCFRRSSVSKKIHNFLFPLFDLFCMLRNLCLHIDQSFFYNRICLRRFTQLFRKIFLFFFKRRFLLFSHIDFRLDGIQPVIIMLIIHTSRIDLFSQYIDLTFQLLLRDMTGLLSSILTIFAQFGANILTINQAIPTNGCASVTISAETSGISQGVEALMRALSQVDGVRKVEVLAG